MGWMYETKLKDYSKAEECYRKALDAHPSYPSIYTNYSILLSTLGKYDELKLLLDRALTVPVWIKQMFITNTVSCMSS